MKNLSGEGEGRGSGGESVGGLVEGEVMGVEKGAGRLVLEAGGCVTQW